MTTDGGGNREPDPDDGDAAVTGADGPVFEARRRRLVGVLLDAPDLEPGGFLSWLGRLCAVSVLELEVSGAGITVMGSTESGIAGHRDQLWATGPLARRLEDLQLTAGEGPCLEAYAGGAPVLAGDLVAEPSRWLGFAPEAIAAGAAALFSLPLQVGALRLGTLDLHRDTAGSLSREQLADALVLASLATETLLELVGDPDPHTPDAGDGARAGTARLLSETVGWLPDVHAEIHQASGMVSVGEDIGVGEALLRIRAYAYAHGEPIDQVAHRIVNRDLVLLDGPEDHDHGDPDEGPPSPDGERQR